MDCPYFDVWQPESVEYSKVEGSQIVFLGFVRLNDVVNLQPAVLPLHYEVGVESDGEVGVGDFGNIFDINSNGDSNWLVWRQLKLTTKETFRIFANRHNLTNNFGENGKMCFVSFYFNFLLKKR